jgi:hypothetical protein
VNESAEIPHLEKRDDMTKLIVDGWPGKLSGWQ